MKSTISTLAALALTAGLLLQLTGCNQSVDEPAAADPMLATPVPEGMVRGTVLETMDSGGYTYVLLVTDRDTRWTAAQQVDVQVGDIVQVSEGMAMTDFTSNTLGRTFDVIYFTSAMTNLSRDAAPVEQQEAAEIAMPPGHPDPDSTAQTDVPDTTVAELEPGQNIAYVYANKDSLADQQVSLRGKVVKYNANILGWNFIHIQDGSGDNADGSHDLTITSKDTTAVGETIVVTGALILDKDFGAGYRFPLIMEDASITAE